MMHLMEAALTIKKIFIKNLPLYAELRDNKIEPKKYFFASTERKEVFIKKTKQKITRKDIREHLVQFHLACELVKVIRHFFPDLIPNLKQIKDPRNRSYIKYEQHVLLMTKILSSIFYISSMRKTSEEFNNETAIKNIGILCGREELEELPYWETINRYLERLEPEELQKTVCRLVGRLIRSRAFEKGRMRERYWQIIVDGTQLESSRKELDKKSLYRVHKKGTAEEYREYYYYVLEAKLLLHEKIVVSIMTEFVENEGSETEKQDCERKACFRLMERLKREFPMLPICMCGDSLYACERFFRECGKKKWHFLLRFKEGSIPTVYKEYKTLKEEERNRREWETEKETLCYDYVNKIDYNGIGLNFVEYEEKEKATGNVGRFYFLTDFQVSQKNVRRLVEEGRRRWKIENEGFNTQKQQGYYLEHMYSRNYQAMKNHYYLIQIGHMISQVMEAWEKLWKKVKQSREQKHRRLLESWKQEKLEEYSEEMEKAIQIRLG